jgi:SAM-dependent methyltransferase
MDIRTVSAPAVQARRNVERDRIVCFACGSTNLTSLENLVDHHASTGNRYALVVCRSCGSGRLRDALTTEQLEALYPDTFYSYEVPRRRHPVLLTLERFRYNRHRFKPHFSSLLEIGSGAGEFLATIKNRGRVIGLERSEAARRGGQKLGVDVHVGDVVDASLFDEKSFDYVYLSHSFEHLDDPAAALASIHRWLADDGRVFFAVPNFGGLLPRLFRKSWYNLALPLHVSQFTRDGLQAMLARSGFRVERIACNSDPISLPMTAYFSSGGTVGALATLHRAVVTVTSLICVPLSRLLDRVGVGDCIEVHARKVG